MGLGGQAPAGGADQLCAVAIGQCPGVERLGPGPTRRLPAHLVRAAPLLPAPDRVNTDIECVHAEWTATQVIISRQALQTCGDR